MATRGRKPAVSNVVSFSPTGVPLPKKKPARQRNPLKRSLLKPSPDVLADELALDAWTFYIVQAPHLREIDSPMLGRLCLDESIATFIHRMTDKIRPVLDSCDIGDTDTIAVLLTQFNKMILSRGTTYERIRKTQSELGLTPTTVDRVSGTSSKDEGSGIQQWL